MSNLLVEELRSMCVIGVAAVGTFFRKKLPLCSQLQQQHQRYEALLEVRHVLQVAHADAAAHCLGRVGGADALMCCAELGACLTVPLLMFTYCGRRSPSLDIRESSPTAKRHLQSITHVDEHIRLVEQCHLRRVCACCADV